MIQESWSSIPVEFPLEEFKGRGIRVTTSKTMKLLGLKSSTTMNDRRLLC